MSGVLIGQLILWLIIAVIVIAIVVYLVNWLYHRSSKEVSFVRTGLFGERVVINGGAFVLPFIHDFTPVNMNVLQMEVVREKGDALITRDRMRVDIEAEFYVRVKPTNRGGIHRGRDARPPHHGAGAPACAALRQIRLGAALDRFRNDDGGDARAARRLRHAREGGRRRGPGPERPRARIRRHHRPRPDRSRIFQSVEPLRRRRLDPAHPGDRDAPEAAQRHRAGIR